MNERPVDSARAIAFHLEGLEKESTLIPDQLGFDNNKSGNLGLNDVHEAVVTLMAGRDVAGRLAHLCPPHNLIWKPGKFAGTL